MDPTVSSIELREPRPAEAASAVAREPASEGGHEHLQRRLSLLVKVMLGLGAIVQTQAFVMLAFGHGLIATWKPFGHLVVLAVAAGIWLRTRSGVRSARELVVLDALAVLAPVAFWCVAFWDAPPTLHPVQLLLLVVANVLPLRSVLVPSTGLRTAVLGAIATVMVTAWTYGYVTLHVPAEAAWLRATVTGLTCTLSLAIATVASHTIFGLRKAVREAKQLGPYTLLRKLGEGGMGVVWEARHALLRRKTAVKLLPAERAGEEAIARFEREVQLTSTLTHPNTIAIYDYGRSEDGTFYYAMEHLDGIDLQALIDRSGPQSPGLVAHVLAQLCDALAEAHAVGLIHRDVKPANVILCERGGHPLVTKVLDFGLVKCLDGCANERKVSASNLAVGTPLYMAPEALVAPERVDARSDLYSVGALGYYLLTGEPVFSGKSHVEIFAHHMHSKPVPPSERLGRDVPRDLEAILLDCLEKDPNERPASAAEVSERLAATSAKRGFGAAEARSEWERCVCLCAERRLAN